MLWHDVAFLICVVSLLSTVAVVSVIVHVGADRRNRVATTIDPFLLEAMREVDAMLPWTPRIATDGKKCVLCATRCNSVEECRSHAFVLPHAAAHVSVVRCPRCDVGVVDGSCSNRCGVTYRPRDQTWFYNNQGCYTTEQLQAFSPWNRLLCNKPHLNVVLSDLWRPV